MNVARPALLPALAALALSSGCSAFGVTTSETPKVAPFSAASADAAKVCVVRSGFPAPLYTTVVYDNQKLVGATKHDTYFCYEAEPGQHVIVSDGTFGVRTTVLAAEAGHRYYLKQSWLLPAVRGHALSWIDESVAQADIADTEYAVLTEVPADKALPEAPLFAPAAR